MSVPSGSLLLSSLGKLAPQVFNRLIAANGQCSGRHEDTSF
jgi:hypothetical protein